MITSVINKHDTITMQANQIESGWYSRSGPKNKHYFLAELGKYVCGLKGGKFTTFGHDKPKCKRCENQLKSLELLGVDDFLMKFTPRDQWAE